MPIAQKELFDILQNHFPDSVIDIQDLAGDNDHYKAIIKSKSFNGLSKIKQHQMVYKALGSLMGTTLHALALETKEMKD